MAPWRSPSISAALVWVTQEPSAKRGPILGFPEETYLAAEVATVVTLKQVMPQGLGGCWVPQILKPGSVAQERPEAASHTGRGGFVLVDALERIEKEPPDVAASRRESRLRRAMRWCRHG